MNQLHRAVGKINKEVEKLSIKTMAEYVRDYLIEEVTENVLLAMKINDTNKSMAGCLKYITGKAKTWLQEQQEMLMESKGSTLAGEVPREICYQWAVDYFLLEEKEEKQTNKKKDEAEKDTAEDKLTSNQLALF